jgi:hypothetical protein
MERLCVALLVQYQARGERGTHSFLAAASHCPSFPVCCCAARLFCITHISPKQMQLHTSTYHLGSHAVSVPACVLCWLQSVLEELQDVQQGILSVTSPATQQDLAALAVSINSSAHRLQQQQQQQQQQQREPDGAAGGVAAGHDSSSNSSKLRKLFAAGGSSSSPAASIQGS